MRNSEKQQWIAQYKQSYSIISQATLMIQADNGGTMMGAWDSDEVDMYDAYSPYLKVAKECRSMNIITNGCWAPVQKSLNGTIRTYYLNHAMVLSNGTFLDFSAENMTSGCPSSFTVDSNGAKGPNVMGKDIQRILICAEGTPVRPAGNYLNTEGYIQSNCPANLQTETGSGNTCGVRIIRGDYAEDY